MNNTEASSSELAVRDMDVDNENSEQLIRRQGKVVDNVTNPTDSRSENEIRNPSQIAIDFTNRYKPTDKGPFYVFVEHKDKSLGKLFPMRVGYYLRLHGEYKKSIEDIKVVRKNRVKVVLNNFNSANNMINNYLLTKNGLLAYIPKFYTQKKGLLRMVDTFFSDEYLLNYIESDRNVLEIKRLERRIVDEQGREKMVKRQMVVVSFEGNELPAAVRINGVHFPVDPYIFPVVQCKKCLRYGHITKLCKNNDSLCKICSKSHDEGACENQAWCIYCNTADHPSISNKCPVFLKQKRIKERMAKQNLSFKEAQAIEESPSYANVFTNNRFDILNNLENFPSLNQPSTSQQTFVTKPRYNSFAATVKASQNSNNNFPKKRKAAKEPIRPSSAEGEAAPLAIPNPYAVEFRQYKQNLRERLITFFEDFITRIQGDNDNLFTYNIRDSLNSIIMDSDDSTHLDKAQQHPRVSLKGGNIDNESEILASSIQNVGS